MPTVKSDYLKKSIDQANTGLAITDRLSCFGDRKKNFFGTYPAVVIFCDMMQQFSST